ncbi:MAG: hypothetical protein R3D05_13555 [Dongiaceae bacterium]
MTHLAGVPHVRGNLDREPRVHQSAPDCGDQEFNLAFGRAVTRHDGQHDRIGKNVTE